MAESLLLQLTVTLLLAIAQAQVKYGTPPPLNVSAQMPKHSLSEELRENVDAQVVPHGIPLMLTQPTTSVSARVPDKHGIRRRIDVHAHPIKFGIRLPTQLLQNAIAQVVNHGTQEPLNALALKPLHPTTSGPQALQVQLEHVDAQRVL